MYPFNKGFSGIFIFIPILLIIFLWLFSYHLFIVPFDKYKKATAKVEEIPPPAISDLIVSDYIDIPSNAKIVWDSRIVNGKLIAPNQITIGWASEFKDGALSSNAIYFFP